jgi:hypothetical protein
MNYEMQSFFQFHTTHTYQQAYLFNPVLLILYNHLKGYRRKNIAQAYCNHFCMRLYHTTFSGFEIKTR